MMVREAERRHPSRDQDRNTERQRGQRAVAKSGALAPVCPYVVRRSTQSGRGGLSSERVKPESGRTSVCDVSGLGKWGAGQTGGLRGTGLPDSDRKRLPLQPWCL